VSPPTPSVTIIIPTRPEQSDIKAVTSSRMLDYPGDKLEIIVARGKQPSVQRNTALKTAGGELIYFLDDDSMPPPDNLRRAVAHFADPAVKMLGGPNLCPPDAPAIEKVFALVLASWALGPSRARYYPVGKVRQTSEKELILCNLVARRDSLLELGGFNEALYPNEENALMDELQKRGGKLIYDPQFFVHRRPRSNLKSFAKMLMTYGRGRAEQFRVHPTFGSALNFVPPLFCVYLVLLLPLMMCLGKIALAPLVVYGGAVAVMAAMLAIHGQIFYCLAAIPLIVLTHVLYGFGFWRGLFTKLRRPGAPGDPPPPHVVLETLPS
jgi:cellulose synthase/poly-beta-1,6-N-acetylglucosamine synthase-like glycosyltransferase